MADSGRRSAPGWIAAAFVVLLTNSAYVAAAPSATLFYYANVALHVLLGVVVAIAAVVALAAGRLRLNVPQAAAALLTGVGAAFGLVVAGVGATTPHRSMLLAHAGISIAGSILLVLAFAATRSHAGAPRAGRRVAAAALVLGAVIAAAFTFRLTADRRWRQDYRIVNPVSPPLSMNQEGAGADGPFFPSSANTTVV